MGKVRASFDFDDTFDREVVRSFARWCAEQGIEVWIVTSRYPDSHWADKNPQNWVSNADLWAIVDAERIPRHRVCFTGHQSKAQWFRHAPDFIFHLDDDRNELREAVEFESPVPFVDSKGSFWIRECKRYIPVTKMG